MVFMAVELSKHHLDKCERFPRPNRLAVELRKLKREPAGSVVGAGRAGMAMAFERPSFGI